MSKRKIVDEEYTPSEEVVLAAYKTASDSNAAAAGSLKKEQEQTRLEATQRSGLSLVTKGVEPNIPVYFNITTKPEEVQETFKERKTQLAGKVEVVQAKLENIAAKDRIADNQPGLKSGFGS